MATMLMFQLVLTHLCELMVLSTTSNATKQESGATATVSKIKRLLDSSFTQDFDEDRRKATICALLRHGVCSDGKHLDTRTPSGLHPSYIMFMPQDKSDKKFSRMTLVKDSLADVFDAVSSFVSAH